MASKVFISYRREDSKGEARSIYQTFEREFGRDRVFMDVDNIRKGLDFRKVLHGALAETAVMVVVMGRRWLSSSDDNGRRRLDDPADFVRIEITNALQRDIPVIPVCVDGARLPSADELPEEMRSLVMRQATSITHEKFARDMEGILEDIKPLIGRTEERAGTPWGAIAAGVAALAVLAGGGLWWTAQTQPGVPTATPVAVAPIAPAPATAPPSSASQEAAVREAAAAVLRQQQEERERKEADVRRRVEEEMAAEARRKAEIALAAAQAAAQRQAEEDARRQIERARLEAEAEALRKVREEQQRQLEEKARAEQAKTREAEQRASARKQEAAAVWSSVQQNPTLQGYLDYLRQYRDQEHAQQARSQALPHLKANVEQQIDDSLDRSRRADGSVPFYNRHPDDARAAAMCIDWSASSALNLRIMSRGSSGGPNQRDVARQEAQALAFCQNFRKPEFNCTCEVVRRNKDNVTNFPKEWIDRQLN